MTPLWLLNTISVANPLKSKYFFIQKKQMMKKSMMTVIEKNRNLFASYNISRLRELIRYLSEDKFDLFQTIPFLLNVNLPAYPGYVETEEVFYGIFNFHHSGFYKYALNKFGLKPEATDELMPKQPVIQGLYLMGSAGTLTQSEKSDFDYWVVVDGATLSDSGVKLLAEKVKNIENWCYDQYRQEVTFFIMDVLKIKQNDFSVVDSESSGSAQKTLLKEEFYRTFIMLAGKVPLWSVLPSGITDDDYNELVDSENDVKDYIDTGNLLFIDPGECLGAVLWQVYKARNDPVKSLIKASLIAFYFFNAMHKETIVCNILRDKFSESKIEDHLFDPYTIVFEKIIQFYIEIDDVAGLRLIRKCILLRLLGYPLTSLPDLSSPKGKLLLQLAGEWKFDLDLLSRFKKFHSWPEEEKLEFENGVFDKISFIYELILRSSDDLVKIDMAEEDLGVLVNRTAAFKQKVEGKIASASTFLRKKNKDLLFTVKEESMEDGCRQWTVYGKSISDQPDFLQPVYRSNSYLESAGWLVVNRFVMTDGVNVEVQPVEKGAGFTHPAESFRGISDFFDGFFPRPDAVYQCQRASEGILFFLKTENECDGEGFSSADYLLLNSWGELYFNSLDFSPLESIAQKCYKIAITILQLLQERDDYPFKYFICHPERIEDQSIPDLVTRLVDEMVESGEVPDSKTLNTATSEFSSKKNKPFLDIL